MSKTWEDRPLSKSKIALKEIENQLNIIKEDILQSSKSQSISLIQKINIIEDWYALNHIACEENKHRCKICPFLECITNEWNEEIKQYEESYDCKFNFKAGYAGDIVQYIEKYRDKIDKYKNNEENDEIQDTIEWHNI